MGQLGLCNVEGGIVSCELGMLTGWGSYVSNLLNGIINVNFNTDRVVSYKTEKFPNFDEDNTTTII
jgi:hypothetical protein